MRFALTSLRGVNPTKFTTWPPRAMSKSASRFQSTRAMSPALDRSAPGGNASADIARFYQASSSELFGAMPPPQNENTPFCPRSPYGALSCYAHCHCELSRGLWNVRRNGILFNHESQRRGETFVTRKITRAVARIAAGLQDKLYLGEPRAVRDWGYAPEYVEGMWQMMQQDSPEDYVLATGVPATVEQFASAAFAEAGLDFHQYIEIDDSYQRPSEVDALIGDASKATTQLKWRAVTYWDELARLMVRADLEAVEDQLSGRLLRADVRQ